MYSFKFLFISIELIILVILPICTFDEFFVILIYFSFKLLIRSLTNLLYLSSLTPPNSAPYIFFPRIPPFGKITNSQFISCCFSLKIATLASLVAYLIVFSPDE